MVKNKFLKIIAILFLIVTVFTTITPTITYAKSSNYGRNTTFDDTGGSNTSSWIQDVLLGALGKAIYAIGWCIEKIGAMIVKLLTGVKLFPWADKVIMNSVPLLDPNFINPAENSLFWKNSNYTQVGKAIRTTYFTGLSVGVGFFGIIVAVMAIRLAISSIAADKAKYKEAITKWLTALVLLFALHYIISFIFYLNEQLVEVACSIMTNQITQAQAAGSSVKTISGLSDVFKKKATGDWNTDSFIASIIYAVFVIQSLMFFYAYIKRLFYVLILAIISPFVVAYDFLKKVME